MEWSIVATIAGSTISLKFFEHLTWKQKVNSFMTGCFCGIFLSELFKHLFGIKDAHPQLHAFVVFVCAVFGQLVLGLTYKHLERGEWLHRKGERNG